MLNQKYHQIIKQSIILTAKLYIDKNLKRHSNGKPGNFLCDIYHQSHLTKKELYAATTELQVGGVETVRTFMTPHKPTCFSLACFRVTRERAKKTVDLTRLCSALIQAKIEQHTA